MNNDIIIYNKIFCIKKLTQLYVLNTIGFIPCKGKDPEENAPIAKMDLDNLTILLKDEITSNGITVDGISSTLNNFFNSKEAGLQCDAEFINTLREIINNDRCSLCEKCINEINNDCPLESELEVE